jgi:diguanylate cyclase (GGDEF)-like protein/PAS domain S-box-containing protein
MPVAARKRSAPADEGQVADPHELNSQHIAVTVARLLREHPDAVVAAMSSFSALYCDMPAEVPLNGQAIIRRGRFYELVDASSRIAVLDAWRRVRQNGAGTTAASLPSGEPATMCFFDVRDVYGVILAILIPGQTISVALGELAPDLVARSRFGRVWRDDLGRVERMDEAAEHLLGCTNGELLHDDPIAWIHPEHVELAYENWIETLASPREPRRWRCRHRRGDGSYLWVEITNTNHLDDPECGLVLSEMMDISDEMVANERLHEREELLRTLAESLPLGAVQIDMDGAVTYTNSRLHEILGIVHAASLPDLLTNVVLEDRHRLIAAVDRVLSTGVDVDVDVVVERPDVVGERSCRMTVRALHDQCGRLSGTLLTVEDVTESTLLRRELERRANIDALTAAYNRAATLAMLEQVLAVRQQCGLGVAVVYIDLDRFKPINDRLGHESGDEVLVAAAERLRRAVRTRDIVGRIGGDEFLVVCPGVDGPAASQDLAERVVVELVGPCVLANGESVELKASVGVAWCGDERVTSDGLIARADAAMYDAKRRQDGRAVLANLVAGA